MELAPAENNNRLINYRPTFVLAVGMIAGIAVYGLLSSKTVPIFSALVVISSGALLFFGKNRFALFTAAILFGLILSFVFRPTEFKTGEYTVSGVVTDITETGEEHKLILRNVRLDNASLNRYCEITLTDESKVSVGDRISCYASCRMPTRKFSTYDEYHRKLSAKIGSIASASLIKIESHHNAPVIEILLAIRTAISKRIDDTFQDDSDIFNALILGIRTEIGDERYSAYQASGTAHLLALSGFHMGLVSAAIAAIIPKRRRSLRLIVVSAVMILYCSVAVYAPGFVRAAIMSICYLITDKLERRPDSLSSLSLAAILILSVNPYQLYSIGFQLSFAACFGIALFNSSFSRTLNKTRLPSKASSAIAGSSSAILGTTALQMRYFNSFAPYAVICNLFAIPAFSVIVILGIITTVASFILPAAGRVIATAPRAFLFVIEKLLSFFASLPGADMFIVSPPLAGCVIFLVMLFAFSEYTLRPFKKKMWAGLALMFLFTFSCLVSIIKT